MRSTRIFAILLLSPGIAMLTHDNKATAQARINRFLARSHKSPLPHTTDAEPAAIARSLDEMYARPALLERAWNLRVNESAS